MLSYYIQRTCNTGSVLQEWQLKNAPDILVLEFSMRNLRWASYFNAVNSKIFDMWLFSKISRDLVEELPLTLYPFLSSSISLSLSLSLSLFSTWYMCSSILHDTSTRLVPHPSGTLYCATSSQKWFVQHFSLDSTIFFFCNVSVRRPSSGSKMFYISNSRIFLRTQHQKKSKRNASVCLPVI